MEARWRKHKILVFKVNLVINSWLWGNKLAKFVKIGSASTYGGPRRHEGSFDLGLIRQTIWQCRRRTYLYRFVITLSTFWMRERRTRNSGTEFGSFPVRAFRPHKTQNESCCVPSLWGTGWQCPRTRVHVQGQERMSRNDKKWLEGSVAYVENRPSVIKEYQNFVAGQRVDLFDLLQCQGPPKKSAEGPAKKCFRLRPRLSGWVGESVELTSAIRSRFRTIRYA